MLPNEVFELLIAGKQDSMQDSYAVRLTCEEQHSFLPFYFKDVHLRKELTVKKCS